VTRALDMAMRRRRPNAGLLHHSDQGTQYTSEGFQRVLAERGITCSMSRRGNVYDNAAMESWFSTLKSELGERFENHGAAKEQLFDYIEVFYNQQRPPNPIKPDADVYDYANHIEKWGETLEGKERNIIKLFPRLLDQKE
jgi:transposase InsO family protein